LIRDPDGINFSVPIFLLPRVRQFARMTKKVSEESVFLAAVGYEGSVGFLGM